MGSEGDREFYRAVAQVIPVLVLALIVERRLWDDANPSQMFGVDLGLKEDGDAPLRLAAVGLVLLVLGGLFAGEASALVALDGGPSSATKYFCFHALVLGAGALLWPIVGFAIRCGLPRGRQRGFDTNAGRLAVAPLLAITIASTVIGLLQL